MHTTLTITALMISSLLCQAADRARETNFLALLHKLQFVESAEDVAKLVPNCPKPVKDVGEDNTEIRLTTTLFGFPAKGEFNFHKNVLVSHGFQLLTPDYKSAHDVFIECAAMLNEQVRGLRLMGELPFGLDGGDGSDGPRDQITIYVQGIHDNAFLQLRLEMRTNSIAIGWGAGKATAEIKNWIEPSADGNRPQATQSPDKR